MLRLMGEVTAVGERVRARLRALLRDFARRHLNEWNALVAEVRTGATDPRARMMPGAAFRPEFHARKAEEHFEAELWTESFDRYVRAGETLLGHMFAREVQRVEGVDLRAGHPGWFTAFTRWARESGLELDSRPEFQELKRVYTIRSTKVDHGHREATIVEAIDARKAYEGLRLLLDEVFGTRYGVTLASLQDRALFTRTMLFEPADLERVIEIGAKAQELVEDARAEARSVLDRLDMPVPLPPSLHGRLEGLSAQERQVANRAMADAMREDLELLKGIWRASVDSDRIFAEVVEQLAAQEQAGNNRLE